MSASKTGVAIAALAATVVAACGTAMMGRQEANLSAAPPSGAGLPTGQCFRSQEIRNHTVADNRTLLIDVSGRETYRITMSGACLAGATSTDPIITRSPPGSTIICKPIDLDISIAKGGFPSRCIVDSIARMSPGEVAALPPKLKP